MSSTDSPVTLRQQVGSLPAYVLATWRKRYVPDDGVDLEARAILEQEATALRARGLSLVKTCSVGFRSGKYFGRSKQPTAAKKMRARRAKGMKA